MSKVRCRGAGHGLLGQVPGRRQHAEARRQGHDQAHRRDLLPLPERARDQAQRQAAQAGQAQQARRASRSTCPRRSCGRPSRPGSTARSSRSGWARRWSSASRSLTGLRQVSVVNGRLALNNRAIDMRGTSIHEDLPGTGTALTEAGMNRIVADLKAVGRQRHAHPLLPQRAAPAEARPRRDPGLERGPGVAARPAPGPPAGPREGLPPGGGLGARRAQPSVGDHPLGGQRAGRTSPTSRPPRSLFLRRGSERARKLDPTLPISVAIKTGPRIGPQQIYSKYFDMIGLNEYFGWYGRAPDFATLPDYLNYMRSTFPRQALVVTEFGAEARPENATDPATKKGSYAFQSKFVKDHLDIHDQHAVPVRLAVLDPARVRDLPRLDRRRRRPRPAVRHHPPQQGPADLRRSDQAGVDHRARPLQVAPALPPVVSAA